MVVMEMKSGDVQTISIPSPHFPDTGPPTIFFFIPATSSLSGIAAGHLLHFMAPGTVRHCLSRGTGYHSSHLRMVSYRVIMKPSQMALPAQIHFPVRGRLSTDLWGWQLRRMVRSLFQIQKMAAYGG